MSETVLLTGATGFLGMEMLAHLLEQDEHDVVCLIRAPSAEAADERLAAVVARLYDEPPLSVGRVRAVAGDVSLDGLGLSAGDRESLIEGVGSVLHCAASISFDNTLEEARAVNTAGALRMIELSRAIAAAGRLRRHLHVSTAYVAGRFQGVFRETDLDRGQGFRNTYEQSKFDAEQAIGEAAGDLPLAIARPSIVVGDSRSGWTPAFNVIYWPMRAFSRGLMDEVAIDPDGLADIVPIDYVADGLMALLEDETASRHLRARRRRRRADQRRPDRPRLPPVRPRAAADRRRPRLAAPGGRPLRSVFRDRRHARRQPGPRAAGPARPRRAAIRRLLRDADRVRRARPLGQARDHAAGGGCGCRLGRLGRRGAWVSGCAGRARDQVL